jgi:hypothetical protein
MDMVRSILSYFTLSINLWMEALKTVIYIVNRFPSKSVSKTPYELWTGQRSSLNYLSVWGCPAEAKIFNPNDDKLDYKTVSYHFIGYPEKSNGFHFYYLDRHSKFAEMRYATFLEDEMMRGSTVPKKISLEAKWVYMPTTMIHELIPPTLVNEPIIPTCMVGSSSTTPNVYEAHVIQEPEVPNIVDEEENEPHNLENDVPN